MQIRSQRRDALEHRRRILQTAHQLFMEKGIEEVSMHQIAKGAGVGQGTLYRQYGDKGEICTDLMQDSFERFTVHVNDYMERTAGATPRERILYFVHECLDYLVDKMPFICTIQQSTLGAGNTNFYESDPYRFVHLTFASLIREEHERTGRMPQLDPEYAAHAMIAVIGPGISRLLAEGRIERVKLEEQFRVLFIDPFFASV